MNDTDNDTTETAEEAEANAKWQRLGEMVEKNLINFAERQIDDHGLDPFILMLALVRTTVYLGARHSSTEETEWLFRTSADDLEKFIRARMN